MSKTYQLSYEYTNSVDNKVTVFMDVKINPLDTKSVYFTTRQHGYSTNEQYPLYGLARIMRHVLDFAVELRNIEKEHPGGCLDLSHLNEIIKSIAETLE